MASLPEAILNYSEDEERRELIGGFILRTMEDDGQHPYLNEELREEIWTAAANLLRKTEQGGVFRSKITIYCTGVQDGTWIQRRRKRKDKNPKEKRGRKRKGRNQEPVKTLPGKLFTTVLRLVRTASQANYGRTMTEDDPWKKLWDLLCEDAPDVETQETITTEELRDQQERSWGTSREFNRVIQEVLEKLAFTTRKDPEGLTGLLTKAGIHAMRVVQGIASASRDLKSVDIFDSELDLVWTAVWAHRLLIYKSPKTVTLRSAVYTEYTNLMPGIQSMKLVKRNGEMLELWTSNQQGALKAAIRYAQTLCLKQETREDDEQYEPERKRRRGQQEEEKQANTKAPGQVTMVGAFTCEPVSPRPAVMAPPPLGGSMGYVYPSPWTPWGMPAFGVGYQQYSMGQIMPATGVMLPAPGVMMPTIGVAEPRQETVGREQGLEPYDPDFPAIEEPTIEMAGDDSFLDEVDWSFADDDWFKEL